MTGEEQQNEHDGLRDLDVQEKDAEGVKAATRSRRTT
jgi:hypothetical protein